MYSRPACSGEGRPTRISPDAGRVTGSEEAKGSDKTHPWMRLPGCIDVDPISNRHGIAVVALVAQAEEALGPCGFRVDPGASGTVGHDTRAS